MTNDDRRMLTWWSPDFLRCCPFVHHTYFESLKNCFFKSSSVFCFLLYKKGRKKKKQPNSIRQQTPLLGCTANTPLFWQYHFQQQHSWVHSIWVMILFKPHGEPGIFFIDKSKNTFALHWLIIIAAIFTFSAVTAWMDGSHSASVQSRRKYRVV